MPKTKTRKRSTQASTQTSTATQGKMSKAVASSTQKNTAVADTPRSIAPHRSTRRTARSRGRGVESLFTPILVALGCWGLAISFVFFFPEPNHYLYGGMAAIMGIIWSIMVYIQFQRIRKSTVR